jgi:hypothetical protein
MTKTMGIQQQKQQISEQDFIRLWKPELGEARFTRFYYPQLGGCLDALVYDYAVWVDSTDRLGCRDVENRDRLEEQHFMAVIRSIHAGARIHVDSLWYWRSRARGEEGDRVRMALETHPYTLNGNYYFPVGKEVADGSYSTRKIINWGRSYMGQIPKLEPFDMRSL